MVYNVYMMIRYQMYFTPQLKREIQVQARKNGKSQSEIIRETLEEKFKMEKKKLSGADVLLKIAARAVKGRGPRDLSANMFDYLYGDKSPNYGKNAPRLTKAEEKRIDKFLHERRKHNIN